MADLSPYKDNVSFIMLYTGDFVLRYYVWFSQIRSHLTSNYECAPLNFNTYVYISTCNI